MLPSTLDALADLLDIRGGTASAAAAVSLRSSAGRIRALDPSETAAFIRRVKRGRLDGEPGFSPDAAWRIRDIVLGSEEATLAAARAGVPWVLRRLLELGAVSSRDALHLVQHAGITTLSDLQGAIDEGRLPAQVPADRLGQAAAALAHEARLIPLGRALDLLEHAAAAAARCCPAVDLLTPAGGARRFSQLVSSLVLVGRASDPPAAIAALAGMTGVEDVLHQSARRALLRIQQVEIEVRIAAPDEYGTTLVNATGSPQHLRGLRERRGRAGLAAAEEAVYAHAGLPFIPPELREGTGEIEAAAAGRLPALVTREHIRGDLHMHTTRSDGADTLEAMVAECSALGYEYIAITDHSERSAASRTLTRADVARQRSEIEAIRERYPRMHILHGIEVDIMPDGRLDFDDAVLEGLDIVLASLHDAAGQDGPRLTRRCIQAIRHPLVNVITHPANQLVGRRPGYALDFDAVFAAAAETGTALEVDGAPSHLDLDGEQARRAVAAGVMLTIDSDCHRARSLQRQMALGIGTARRGWVEPRHVLNTRPLAEVLAFLAAGRRR